MVKLQDYLPEYYDDVYEMQKLVAAEQVDFGNFDDLIFRTLLNQFVIQADIDGISIFENQLGIDSNSNDSLETRRYNVLMRMLPPKPITLKCFKELLHTLDIPASVNVDYAVRDVITEAKRSEISKDQIKRLKYLLNVYLPANLTFQIITTSDTKTKLKMFVGVATNSEIDVISQPRLVTHAESKTEVYAGSIPSQVFVVAKSRALIRDNTESNLKQFVGSTIPQISIEVKTYPKELNTFV